MGVACGRPHHQFIHLLHGPAFAHDVFKPVPLLHGRPKNDVFISEQIRVFADLLLPAFSVGDIHMNGLGFDNPSPVVVDRRLDRPVPSAVPGAFQFPPAGLS